MQLDDFKETIQWFDQFIIKINQYFHTKTKQLHKPLETFSNHLKTMYPHVYDKNEIHLYFNNERLYKSELLEQQWSSLISNPNCIYVCIPFHLKEYKPQIFEENKYLVYDLRDPKLKLLSGFKFYKNDVQLINFFLEDYYSQYSAFMKTAKHLLGFFRLMFKTKNTKQKIYLDHAFYDTFRKQKDKLMKLSIYQHLRK